MTDLADWVYYQRGQAAGLRGEPIAVCPYTRPDRINAWRRGWRAGRAYYQYGQAAALRGEPIAVCPCRRPDWANAWRTGWRAGEVLRREIEVLRVRAAAAAAGPTETWDRRGSATPCRGSAAAGGANSQQPLLL